MSLTMNMVGGGKVKMYTNYEYGTDGEQITDVSGFTKLYSTSIPYGDRGQKVNARLGVTDETAIANFQARGWDAAGMCYYDSEDQIGAFAGYDFGQEIQIKQVKLWLGRYSGQNKTLIATVEYLDANGNWNEVQDLNISTALNYPSNVFDVSIDNYVYGIRWIHRKQPKKSSNNNITFAGMSVYRAIEPISVYKTSASGLIMPPAGYDGFGPLLIDVEDMQNALNILGVTE